MSAGAATSEPPTRGSTGNAPPAAEPEVVEEKVTNKSRKFLRSRMGRIGAAKRRRLPSTAVGGMFPSHAYFNFLWADAMIDIREMLAEEKTRGETTGNDVKKMFQILMDVYNKYLKLYKTIDHVYDQMAHPQKRLVVKKILDVLIARLLELRWNLVLNDKSEVTYFDEPAMVEGILPKELDMPIPKYYYHDPTPAQQDRDKWFFNVRERARIKREREEEIAKRLAAQRALERGDFDEEEETKDDDKDEDEEEGLPIDFTTPLQIMERARQAKCRAMIARYIFKDELAVRRERRRKQKMQKMQPQRKRKGKKGKVLTPDKAATNIQKLARGFLARLRVKRMRNAEMEFLGIRPHPPDKDSPYYAAKMKCKEERLDLEAAEERRREQRRMRKKQYEEAQVVIYQRLQQIEAPEMAERFKLQIRTWLLDVKETTGKFPDIPKADVGGSQLMICPETLPEEVREKGRMILDPEYAAKVKKEKQKAKEKAKKEKAKAKAKAKGKKGKGKKGALGDPTLGPLKLFDELKDANFEYNRFWRGSDHKENPEQKYEEKHIIREKRQIVADEVRGQVDIAIKEEIEYLRQVIEKKKKKKGKGKKGKGKGKGKKGGKGKGKGKKGKKGKKKKKGKDLTKDRTMESLFEELVQKNIIRSYNKVRVDDLIAQSSFVNGELRTYHSEHPFENKTEERYMPGDANPQPSFGDIIRAVKDACIMPMGSVEIHENSPFLTKSVLLVGPPGSGKKTLVNMVLTELNATLMDLTAANIVGKYPGKPGLKMLMHLIQKVGSAIQPVIFLIDNCERTYMKKVPKGNNDEPKRLKKQIGKFLKAIAPDDLFLLIGLSSEPWLASAKAMKKDYQRMIYIPPADYGTRYLMWKEGLTRMAEILHPDINYTLLAKLSAGWTAGAIKKTCQDVFHSHSKALEERKKENAPENDPYRHLGRAAPTRLMKFGRINVTMDKLLQVISEYDPVFLEQEKLWNKWWNKTPLQKARLATQVKGDKKKKDKKGKKGKKK